MPTFLLVPMLWCLLGAPLRHPSDAPDVDLRVRIEKDELRYDVAMNLGFVDEVLDFPREEEDRLHPAEHEGLRGALTAFLKETCQVRVDGRSVPGHPRDFGVEEGDMTMLPLFPRLGARGLIQVRMVLVHPLPKDAKLIEFGWSAYPPDTFLQVQGREAPPMTVRAVLSVLGDDRRIEFSEARPSRTWIRKPDSFAPRFREVPPPPRAPRWALPWLSGVCGLAALVALLRRRSPWFLRLGPAAILIAIALYGWDRHRVEVPAPFAKDAALPDADAARAIFQPLHANIYRAFDYTKEGEIYDALEHSVSGSYLERLYQQVYESLVLRDEGGAMSRVQSVEPQDFALLAAARDASGRPEFEVRARWRVKGAVFHWGHDHVRVHEYEARYRVRALERGWRISDHEVLSQLRKPRLESLDTELPTYDLEIR